jgi:hypothetical protein
VLKTPKCRESIAIAVLVAIENLIPDCLRSHVDGLGFTFLLLGRLRWKAAAAEMALG